MKKEIVAKLNISFEDAAYQEEGVEYWFARDLQDLLDYTDWRNFLGPVFTRAQYSFPDDS